VTTADMSTWQTVTNFK